MMKWLNTIRWKNLAIIWISIVVILIPHFSPDSFHMFIEFILWGIVCTSIASIGNITNDLLDVKQDRENKKKNIFIDNKHKKTAFVLIFIFLGIAIASCLMANNAATFLVLSGGALLLLLLYNLLLKKIVLIGNMVIGLLTLMIFLGMDLIVISRTAYYGLGFENKQIELLGLFAFITTIIREILKDAEDRKGDKFAGFNTIAKFLSDKWIAIIIITLNIVGCWLTYILMNKRQTNFLYPLYIYSLWSLTITISASVFMIIPYSSRYVIATRIIKGGMIGCLIIYLFLSL